MAPAGVCIRFSETMHGSLQREKRACIGVYRHAPTCITGACRVCDSDAVGAATVNSNFNFRFEACATEGTVRNYMMVGICIPLRVICAVYGNADVENSAVHEHLLHLYGLVWRF